MVKIIGGLMGGSVAKGSSSLSGSAQLVPLLQKLQKHDISELDTARVYNGGKSEEDLGAVPSDVKNSFAVATKVPGFSPGSLTYDKVIASCNASLAALQTPKVDLFYYHGPDRATPLVESLRAINDLYHQDKFHRFGISNYHVTEVEEIQSLCAKHDFVRPTVYQGGYNAIGRAAETELFPTLRKYGMVFYAFSPLAGGYFSRTAEQLRTPPAGSRMDQMKQFSSMYVNDLSLELHDKLSVTCAKEGLTLKEATLRWLMHHSALGRDDGVILGASSLEQMEENLRACEGGPLGEELVELYEEVWKRFYGAGYSQHYSIPL
ncbi:hypothetical protein B0A48_02105 [Cryoendolithus antarcticus]|uniref:NADP-dependent oxidoreductase domain-containing protein n=1 Tax=Cryoendolithus antarcticus TaxID=1507870 RepID=A0A1V8TMN6_9PEZI|nr:hypothetical protein B0A48_02105 [Cryoendolithus antarcticus]